MNLNDIDLTKIVRAQSPFLPAGWKPLPLQLAFSCLPHTEILYGGAAGGAKSEALLYAALAFVDHPKYAAVIYRKTYQDLIRPGALLDRAIEWLTPYFKDGIRYDKSQHIFTFPSGAKLAFGHMGRKGTTDTMQGAEYHFIGIDEVCQHSETDITYALSRLRRKTDEDIPLRARFTANPGGPGHAFIFKRFKLIKNRNFDRGNPHSPMYIGSHPKKLFIPSRLADNPYIDQAAYVQQLQELDPITRSRLLEGDWSASPYGRFKKEWFRRYDYKEPYYRCDKGIFEKNEFHFFATVDVAASYKEGVGGRQFYTSGGSSTDISAADPCWTVVAVWGVWKNKLFLMDVRRAQTEIPEVFDIMKQVQHKWGRLTFAVEKNGVGAGVVQGAGRLGFNVEAIWTSNDKIINSYDAANMAQQGSIYIPARLDDEEESAPPEHSWLDDWEGEVFTWMGLKDEPSDQVDTLSTAARRVSHMCLDRIGDNGVVTQNIPTVHGICRYGQQTHGY